MGVALVAILLAIPRPTVKASKGKPLPFRAVLGRVWLYGMALALASAGFGVIATFITLFYDAKGWDGAAFALTLFSCAFVGTRLLFPNGINRIGGLNVAMICFSVEIIGHRNGGCIAESGELQKQSGNGGGGESGKAKVDLWMKMTLCQQLADIHRGRTGKEGDEVSIPGPDFDCFL
eukprot:801634_1